MIVIKEARHRAHRGAEMSVKFEISFAPSAQPMAGLAILLKGIDSEAPAGAGQVDPASIVGKAARIAGYSAKSLKTLDIVAPEGSPVDRILVLGTGKPVDAKPHDWLKLGGVAASRMKKVETVTVYLDSPGA